MVLIGRIVFSLKNLKIIDQKRFTVFSPCVFHFEYQSIIIPRYFIRVNLTIFRQLQVLEQMLSHA